MKKLVFAVMMTIQLVVSSSAFADMEACKSEFDAQQFTNLKVNSHIGSLYTSNETGLRYQNVDYRNVLQKVEQGKELNDAMEDHLDHFQKTQEPISSKQEN